MACSHPTIIKGRVVPCGKCVSCRKRKINDWYVRGDFELRLHPNSSWWIGLSYRPEALPEDGVLYKPDYQRYLKRVRITFERLGFDYDISYLLSGEYGKKNTKRAHYHLCLFGIPYNEVNKEILFNLWYKHCGFAAIKPLVREKVKYTVKYSVKTLCSSKETIDGRVVSEFLAMSKKRPIGWKFLDSNQDYLKSILEKNLVVIDKYSYCIPQSFRYYVKKNNIEINIPKTYVILFNDLKFDSEKIEFTEEFNNFKKLMIDTWKIDNCVFKFVSFKEYFQDIESRIDKEKIYCTIHKIDFSEYYIKKYKYSFPFVRDKIKPFKLFYFIKGNQVTWEEYFKYYQNWRCKRKYFGGKYLDEVDEEYYDSIETKTEKQLFYEYLKNNKLVYYYEFLKNTFYSDFDFLFY